MKPNVAFLLPHFRAGGAERVVLNYLRALDRDRFTPYLILGQVEGEFLAQLPGDVQPLALGGRRAVLWPRHIATILKAQAIDVAYSATNAMNLALLAAPTGIVRIVSEHTPPLAYLAQAKLPWLRRRAMRHFYPRAEAIITPTAAIADALAAVIGRPIAAHALANPVVDNVPDLAPPYPARAPIRIITAGRLVAAKGFDTLIEACALVHTAGVGIRVDILGEGVLRPTLQTQIDTAGLAAIVRLRGHVEDVATAVAAADLFVLPSRREGFGNVAIEAMAAGTPVLATRAGGPETFIRDGENGFLVAPDDPAALAATIARLAADPAARQAVRHAGLATARRYTIAQATRHFEALVSQTIR